MLRVSRGPITDVWMLDPENIIYLSGDPRECLATLEKELNTWGNFESKFFPPFKSNEKISDVNPLGEGGYGKVFSCKLGAKEAVVKIPIEKTLRANEKQIEEAYSHLLVFCNLEGKGILKVPKIIKLRSAVDALTLERQNLIFMQKLDDILCDKMNRKIIQTVALTLLAFEARRWAHNDVKCDNMMKSGDNLYLIDFGHFEYNLKAEDAKKHAAANMAYFLLHWYCIFRQNQKIEGIQNFEEIMRRLVASAKSLVQEAQQKTSQKVDELFLVPFFLPDLNWSVVHPFKIFAMSCIRNEDFYKLWADANIGRDIEQAWEEHYPGQNMPLKLNLRF